MVGSSAVGAPRRLHEHDGRSIVRLYTIYIINTYDIIYRHFRFRRVAVECRVCDPRVPHSCRCRGDDARWRNANVPINVTERNSKSERDAMHGRPRTMPHAHAMPRPGCPGSRPAPGGGRCGTAWHVGDRSRTKASQVSAQAHTRQLVDRAK
jgi:hypothetical protein